MKYNPEIHHRRSIRLMDYDYSDFGFYFVTICTFKRELYFDNLKIKKIVELYWKQIPNNFKDVKLNTFIVMPNHLHGIIIIKNVRARFIAPNVDIAQNAVYHTGFDKSNPYNWHQKYNPMLSRKPILGKIIRYYKAKTTHKIRKSIGEKDYFAWQRNYYEHIIRNQKELNQIRDYIINNPKNWDQDTNNPKNFKM